MPKHDTCLVCGSSVGRNTNHEEYCSSRCKIRDIGGIEYDDAPEHVYTLKMVGGAGDIYYYVGASCSVETRVRCHVANPPSPTWFSGDLDVVDIVSVDPVFPDSFGKPSQDAKEKEHKTAMRIAVEEETTNVFGGK